MKINDIKYVLLFLMAFTFVACDTIEENERYIEKEVIEKKRNVLLEEFTGQNCPNCPQAHRVVNALKEQYGESVVAVSIHAGPFAYEEGRLGPNYQAFKTEESNAYADLWDIPSYPSGIVNRVSGAVQHQSWGTFVENELQKDAKINIELEALFNEDSTVITITSSLKPMADIEGNLQLWITEDDIVSYQLDGTTPVVDYTHKHIFRTSVNGFGGEEVSLTNNVFETKVHDIAIQEKWNKKNLNIVAFVYNNSEGVLQVVEAAVK